MLHEVRRRSDEFDLLHFHVDLLQFAVFGDVAGKTLTTLHGRLDLKDLAQAYAPGRSPAGIDFPPPAKTTAVFEFGGYRHRGSLNPIPVSSRPRGGYLAFLAVLAEPARDRGVAIARGRGLSLRIAAKVDVADAACLARRWSRLLNEDARFLGEIGGTAADQVLGEATALLFPIDWPRVRLVMIRSRWRAGNSR